MLGNGRWVLAIGAAALVAAAASLVLPFAPAFDAWAWLVWGRELVGFDLDTTAGPSWKPLPVFLATPLAPLGDAAPDLWLLIARLGWLAAIPLVWHLAAELSGARRGAIAGAVAALGLLLLSDAYTPWLRQFAVGLSEPLLVALCLLAVTRALAKRPGHALAAGGLACLIRPEAWPFLAAYALWACRRDAQLRLPAAGVGVVVLLAWFTPDLLGAGNPLEGAERARGLDDGGAGEALDVLERALHLAPPAIWPLAALGALAPGHGRRERAVLAAGAGAWILLVAAMATVGFAGLPRFMAPAAAVICALGGVGAAELARALAARVRPSIPIRRALAGAMVLAVAATMIPRMAELSGEYDEAERRGSVTNALQRAADRAGAPPPGCTAVISDDALGVTAIAWKLDLPLDGATYASNPPPFAGLAFANEAGTWTAAEEEALGPPVAVEGPWAVYRPCPGNQRDASRTNFGEVYASAPSRTGSASRAIAGVTGARR